MCGVINMFHGLLNERDRERNDCNYIAEQLGIRQRFEYYRKGKLIFEGKREDSWYCGLELLSEFRFKDQDQILVAVQIVGDVVIIEDNPNQPTHIVIKNNETIQVKVL